jgi:hypothetical protein
VSKIPVTSSRVKIDGLHPRFIARLEAFFADPRIANRVAVVSGVRSYAQQKYLYDGYKARKRGFNLAANPDRKRSNGWQGSFHMAQPSYGGFGYAVDLRITGKGITTGEVKKIATQYGMHAPIRSEWWHFVPGSIVGNKFEWLPYDASAEPPSPDPKDVLAEVAKFVEACKDTVLRRGDRGAVVEFLQTQLDKDGHRLTRQGKPGAGIDGVFGKMTDQAVRQFQRDEGLAVDGIVGPVTWDTLMD